MDVFDVVAQGQQKYLRDAVVRAARELRGVEVKGERRLRKLHAALELFGIDPANPPEPGPVPDGGWGRLAEVIRTDRPIATAPEDLRRFHEYLFAAGTEPARELWTQVGAAGPLLDLGGGAGAYSAAFPGEATLADLPEVLRLSRAPRARLLALDILNTDNYPPGHGVALLANLLHLFGEHDCAAIVRKASAALNPGGLLVVKDLDATTAQGVLFALNMALFTAEGDVHPQSSIERWLVEVGLEPPRRLALRTSPESLLLVARKP